MLTPARHEYREVADTRYPHLVSPQCKCGELWVSGYVRKWYAALIYERHVNAS